MRVDRLVGYSPEEVLYYTNYQESDFLKIYLEPKKYKIKSKEEGLAWCLAKYLKESKVWIGDRFVYNNQTYILSDVKPSFDPISLGQPPVLLEDEDMDNLFSVKRINPSLRLILHANLEGSSKICVIKFEDALWVKEGK